jgi:uncharacterized HAD superfamily protein
MDRLAELFQRQRLTQDKILKISKPDDSEKGKLTQSFILHIFSEVNSLLETQNWKTNVLKTESPVKSNILNELVDISKLVVSLCNLWEITPDEFYEAYLQKSDIVDKKFDKEAAELQGKKIIATDIDGVLADWYGGLLLYAEQHFERRFDISDLTNHHISAVKKFGISKTEEEELKSGFIESGGYKTLYPIPGCSDILQKARSQGWTIIEVTSRPEKQHKRVYGDTLSWLDKSNVPYDFIFWGSNKADIVSNEIYPAKITYFIEDRLDNAVNIAKHYPDTTVLLLNYKYNIDGDISKYPNIIRVQNWKDIGRIILDGNREDEIDS